MYKTLGGVIMGKFTRFSTLILFTLLIAITSIALAGTQKPFAYMKKLE